VAYTSGNLSTLSGSGTGAPWFSQVHVRSDGQCRYQTTPSGPCWRNLGIQLHFAVPPDEREAETADQRVRQTHAGGSAERAGPQPR
jgi:hypothetical protein